MTDIGISYLNGATITEALAILERYQITLLTSVDEFSPEPDFGIGLNNFISETNNAIVANQIAQLIKDKTKTSYPEIVINTLNISRGDINTLIIILEVTVIPYAHTETLIIEV